MSILTTLQNTGRIKTMALAGVSILFCLVMISFRMYYTSGIVYLFLVWNLMLACIPYLVSTLIVCQPALKKGSLNLFAGAAFWLLFFPNAPYIFTDLFHLKLRPGIPLWFDTLLVLSFAWNGLIIGYLSLIDMQQIVGRLYGKAAGWIFVTGSIIAASFGVYLGRFLRWNSWDILASPLGLANDIFARLTDPFAHPRTFGLTILYSAFLLGAYLMIRHVPTYVIHPQDDAPGN